MLSNLVRVEEVVALEPVDQAGLAADAGASLRDNNDNITNMIITSNNKFK